MRSIFVLIATVGFLSASAFAQAQQKANPTSPAPICDRKCTDDKNARDGGCPAADNFSSASRSDCLRRSQGSYNSCLQSCAPSQPSPAQSRTY